MLAGGMLWAQVGGVYEIAIGVRSLERQVEYWEKLGYRVEQRGALTAEQAGQVYGVAEAVESVRMSQGGGGRVRLMKWEFGDRDGLAMSPLKVQGGRWAYVPTAAAQTVLRQMRALEKQGGPVAIVSASAAQPLLDPGSGTQLLLAIQPYTRSIFYQPGPSRVGTVRVGDGPFQTGPATHAGIVVQCPKDSLRFYDEVLGLQRAPEKRFTAQDAVARALLDLQPGEEYALVDFAGPGEGAMQLRFVWFAPNVRMPDLRERVRAGATGLWSYTMRVTGIDDWREKVRLGGAADVQAVQRNEFGERSFSFRGPEGGVWSFVE